MGISVFREKAGRNLLGFLPLLLWPLLWSSGNISGRRTILAELFPSTQRRDSEKSRTGRRLERHCRQKLRHCNGMHHTTNPAGLSTNFSEVKTCYMKKDGGRETD